MPALACPHTHLPLRLPAPSTHVQKLCNYTATLRTGEGSDEGLHSMEQGLKVELALVSGGVKGDWVELTGCSVNDDSGLEPFSALSVTTATFSALEFGEIESATMRIVSGVDAGRRGIPT